MIEAPDAPPRSASRREYLRGGLPDVYRDGKFGMELIQALEEVLDPVVCLLDTLPAHLDPELAPGDLLAVVAAWLGLEADDMPDRAQRRELVRRAPEIWKWRGTRRGLELILELTFPGLEFEIHDEGGVSWSSEVDHPPAGAAAFQVASRTALTAGQQAALERAIARAKPAHVVHSVVTPIAEPVR